MGKAEKVVVLSVLFLMVVICAVTFTEDDDSEVKNQRVYAAQKSDGSGAGGPATRVQGRRLRGAASDRGDLGVLRGQPEDIKPLDEAPTQEPEVLKETPTVAEPKTQPESGLLSMGVKTKPAAEEIEAKPEPAPERTLQPDWDLLSLDGLADTYHPDYK